MSSSSELLKSHKLRVTDQRVRIVDVMLEAETAVTYKYLSDTLPSDFDRVTIYRNLKAFEDKQLLHAIPNAEGELYYALCSHTHNDNFSGEHNHDCNDLHKSHAHFKCTKCDSIECLTETPVDGFALPQNYNARQYSLLIQGLCAKCNK